jgi:hypothetical protein
VALRGGIITVSNGRPVTVRLFVGGGFAEVTP